MSSSDKYGREVEDEVEGKLKNDIYIYIKYNEYAQEIFSWLTYFIIVFEF